MSNTEVRVMDDYYLSKDLEFRGRTLGVGTACDARIRMFNRGRMLGSHFQEEERFKPDVVLWRTKVTHSASDKGVRGHIDVQSG